MDQLMKRLTNRKNKKGQRKRVEYSDKLNFYNKKVKKDL